MHDTCNMPLSKSVALENTDITTRKLLDFTCVQTNGIVIENTESLTVSLPEAERLPPV